MTLQTRLQTKLTKYTLKLKQKNSLYNDNELCTILRINFPECIVIIYPDEESKELIDDIQKYVNQGRAKELAHDYLYMFESYARFIYPVLLIKEEK